MNRMPLQKDWPAMLVAILFVAAGLGATWIAKDVAGIEGDAVLVALLLTPIVAYAIFSGRLSELKAGGLEAKFVSAIRQPVDIGLEVVEPSVVEKRGSQELGMALRRLDESQPIILSLTMGSPGRYDRGAILQYIRSLSNFRQFKFVVIGDESGRIVAYIQYWLLERMLGSETLDEDLVATLNNGTAADLRRYSGFGFVTKTIREDASNLDALREMTLLRLEAIVVADRQGKLKGVVERDQLLGKLLLGMAA